VRNAVAPSLRRPDAAREADRALLARRLTQMGLASQVRLVVHENRRVLVHVRGETLRVHRGFAYAPDPVVRAVVTFAQARRSAPRQAARRELVSFPVHDYVPPPAHRPRRAGLRDGDRVIAGRLGALHAALNERHFAGALTTPAFRISHRMRRRLGDVTVVDGGCVIGISRRHVEADGWADVERTLLHEMVHQWQVECGLPPDHGAAFRRKARAVGIEASAQRVPRPRHRGAG